MSGQKDLGFFNDISKYILGILLGYISFITIFKGVTNNATIIFGISTNQAYLTIGFIYFMLPILCFVFLAYYYESIKLFQGESFNNKYYIGGHRIFFIFLGIWALFPIIFIYYEWDARYFLWTNIFLLCIVVGYGIYKGLIYFSLKDKLNNEKVKNSIKKATLQSAVFIGLLVIINFFYFNKYDKEKDSNNTSISQIDSFDLKRFNHIISIFDSHKKFDKLDNNLKKVNNEISNLYYEKSLNTLQITIPPFNTSDSVYSSKFKPIVVCLTSSYSRIEDFLRNSNGIDNQCISNILQDIEGSIDELNSKGKQGSINELLFISRILDQILIINTSVNKEWEDFIKGLWAELLSVTQYYGLILFGLMLFVCFVLWYNAYIENLLAKNTFLENDPEGLDKYQDLSDIIELKTFISLFILLIIPIFIPIKSKEIKINKPFYSFSFLDSQADVEKPNQQLGKVFNIYVDTVFNITPRDTAVVDISSIPSIKIIDTFKVIDLEGLKEQIDRSKKDIINSMVEGKDVSGNQ